MVWQLAGEQGEIRHFSTKPVGLVHLPCLGGGSCYEQRCLRGKLHWKDTQSHISLYCSTGVEGPQQLLGCKSVKILKWSNLIEGAGDTTW